MAVNYRALPVDSTPYQYERFDYNQPLSGLYYNNIADPVGLFDRMANMGLGLTPRPAAANAMPGNTLSGLTQVAGNSGPMNQDQIKALFGQMGSFNDQYLASKASTQAVRDAASARLSSSPTNPAITAAFGDINAMDGYNRDKELAKKLFPVIQSAGFDLNNLAGIPDAEKARVLDEYYRGLQEKNQLPPRGIMDSLAGQLAVGGLFSMFGAPILSGALSGTGLAATKLGGLAKSALDAATLGTSGLAGGYNPAATAASAASKGANYSRAAANAVPGGRTGITTPTGGGLVGSGKLNPAGVGLLGNTAASGVPLYNVGVQMVKGVPIVNHSVPLPPNSNPPGVWEATKDLLSAKFSPGSVAQGVAKNLATNMIGSLLAPPVSAGGEMMSAPTANTWGVNPYNRSPYPELFIRPRRGISNQLTGMAGVTPIGTAMPSMPDLIPNALPGAGNWSYL